MQPARPRPQRLRVLHVAHTVAGGVASFLEEISAYQTAMFGADNVRFVVPAEKAYLPQIDPAQLIEFSPSQRTPRALLAFRRVAINAIAEFQPDILHLHSTFAGALLRPPLRLRRRKERVIYCPHGWSFGMDIPRSRKRAYAAVERLLARQTDLIITNSEDERRLALEAGLPPQKVRTVKNGIAWTDAAPRTKRTGRLRVGFIGRHDRQKGLDLLFDAIRRFDLAHIDFEIVGASIVQQQGTIDAEALPANVRLHGWLSRPETLELLGGLDALVMPSRWDAAPIMATEAMRAGVPVIASNRGGLREIVEHGVGGYVFDLDDPDALGRMLGSLQRGDLSRLGVTARARWESEYVADRMNEATCDAYLELVPAALTSRPRRLVHADVGRVRRASCG